MAAYLACSGKRLYVVSSPGADMPHNCANLMRATLTASLVLVVVSRAAVAAPDDVVAGERAYGRSDFATALRLLRPFADQGEPEAQYMLGMMYRQGHGLPQDDAEAARWFRRAAVQGDPEAQSSLGIMYQHGQGVPQSNIRAYMWFNSSAARGNRTAPELRDGIAQRMTPAQIAEAQKLAKQCFQSRFKNCETEPPRVAYRAPKVSPHETTAPPAALSRIASTGTGFFVSDGGHIITNAHVVEGCRTVNASRGGKLSKVSVDSESDLAIYVSSERPTAFARLRGGREARPGEAVVAIGYPLRGLLSSDQIVTTGIISALSGMKNDRSRIQITAPVEPGSSGGPLLGENGSLVGVVVGKLNAVKVSEATGDIPQNVNFAVSLGTLQSFLNANGIPYALDDSTTRKSPADVTEEASRYTVLIECLRE